MERIRSTTDLHHYITALQMTSQCVELVRGNKIQSAEINVRRYTRRYLAAALPRTQWCMWSGTQLTRLASLSILFVSTAKHSTGTCAAQEFETLYGVDIQGFLLLMES